MRAQFSQEQLKAATSFVRAALSTRDTTGARMAIRLAAGDDNVVFTAHNETLTNIITCPATVTGEPETLLLPGRMFADIVDKLPHTDVTVATAEDSSKVTLKAEGVTITLPTIPLDTWVASTTEATGTQFTVETSALVSAVRTARKAAAASDPLLSSIHLVLKEQTLTAVATDRYRLCVEKLPVTDVDADVNVEATISAAALDSAVSGFTSSTTPTVVRINANTLTLTNDVITSTVTLYDGAYPNWSALVERTKDNTSAATVDAVELVAALVRSETVRGGASAPVAVTINEAGVTLAYTDDTSINETITATIADGADHTFGINPAYLRDGLDAYKHSKVSVAVKSAGDAIRLTPVNDDNTCSRMYIVMPVRLST